MGGVEGTIAKIMEERNKNLDEKATGGASTLATTARKKWLSLIINIIINVKAYERARLRAVASVSLSNLLKAR